MEKELEVTLKGMKCRIAVGLTGVTGDLLKATGKEGIRDLTKNQKQETRRRGHQKTGDVILPYQSKRGR